MKSRKKVLLGGLIASVLLLAIILGSSSNFFGAFGKGGKSLFGGGNRNVTPVLDESLSLDPTIEIVPDSNGVNQSVAPGATELVGEFEVTTTGEGWNLEKIAFTVTDADGSADSSAGLADNVEYLTIRYPTSAGDPTFLDGEQTRYMSGTSVVFPNTGMHIAANTTVVLELYAVINESSDDGGSADSGDVMYFTINTGDDDGNSNGDFEATSLGATGIVVDEDDIDNVTTENFSIVQ